MMPDDDSGEMENSITAETTKERTAVISMVTDIVLLIPSIIVTFFANSMTLYTDLLGDFVVFFTNFMLWLVLHRVRKGMGAYYDYGTGKMENLITVLGACVLVLSLGYIGYTSIGRLISPIRLEADMTLMGAAIMLIAAAAFGYLWARNYKIHKAIPSPITEIQWRVPMSNALIALGILLTLLLMVILKKYPWSAYIDPIVSIILSIYVIYTFYELIKTSLFDLIDKTLDESYQLIITRELVLFFDAYAQFHGVRSRRAGGRIFIDIFLEFDAEQRMGEVRQVVAEMQSSLESKIENSTLSIVLATRPMR